MLKPPGATVQPTNPNVHGDTRGRLLRDEQRLSQPEYQPTFCLTVTNVAPINGTILTGRLLPWRGAIDLEYIIVNVQGVTSEEFVLTVFRSDEAAAIVTGTESGTYRLGVTERWTPGDFLHLSCEGSVQVIAVQLEFRGPPMSGLVFMTGTGGGG